MKKSGYLKKNWFFLVLFLGIIVAFVKRYSYLTAEIVSNPDSRLSFSTQDGVLEQTWQPEVKLITGIEIPYYAESDFSCDVQLRILNDDASRVLAEAVLRGYAFSAGESGKMGFSFQKTDVIQGERYRIQVSLLNASAKGTLQIPSGSNYAGCSIAGEKTGQAAAFTVTFAKYSKLFWLAAVLFPFFSCSLLLMVLTGKKWEETVGLSLFAEGLILYGFGLAGRLEWGIFGVYILSAMCLLTAVYFYNKKEVTFNSFLSPGLWIYLVLFGIIIVTSNGDWLGYRDEMRHWGIAVRDMFYYDAFANHADTTLILPRYLPFAALVEYVFVYMNGMFGEDLLLIAYQVMLLNVLILLCRPLQKKNGRKLLLPVGVAMVCVPVIFFYNISNTIMVDSLLAAITAYVLVCYYSEEMTWFNRIRITGGLLVLPLIKEMGLVFAGLAAFVIFGDAIVTQIRKKKLNLKELLYPVLCVCLILGAYLSWQFYLRAPVKEISVPGVQETATDEGGDDRYAAEDVAAIVEEEGEEAVATAVSASGITPEGLKKVLTGQGEEWQYQVSRNFLIELFEGETYSLASWKVSFGDLLAVTAFLIVSLGYFGYWRGDKIRMYFFAGLILLASTLLCAFLQVTYWFSFSKYEALELTSIDRYLAPYICAVVITAFYLIYDSAQQTENPAGKERYLISALSFALAVSMPFAGIVVEGKDIEGNTTEEITYGHDTIAEILRSVAKRGERAYFICSNSDGYSEYVFRNTVCPIVSKHENWNIVSSEELFKAQYELYGKENIDDNKAGILSAEDWKEELRDCEYVVVFHADELFCQSYQEVFGDTVIGDGCVYGVNWEGTELSLELIGQTGIKGWH